MVDSIAKTLGAGSGIDVNALVSSLVEAQYSVKTKQFETRTETLTAQVSAVSALKSGITGFATALSSLVKGGSLATQPVSGNSAIVKVTALAGAKLSGLTASVEVRSLAAAQVAASPQAVAAGTTTGTGSLRIQFGSYDGDGAFQPNATTLDPIAIGAGDTSLAGIAAKINAANQGLTASVVRDGGGEKLVLKGGNGADRAFTVTAVDATDDAEGTSPLSGFVTVGTGGAMAIASHATDARIALDGVEVRRTSNTIADLVPGVKLELQSASVGTRVSLTSTPATDGLRQAVGDVVATYNELLAILKEATDPVSGSLARDPAALDMQRALRQLTLTDLTGSTDGPRTLAEIGVATNRDGTLSVNSATLAQALVASPGAVEAMFADRGAGASGRGLAAALTAIATAVTSKTAGLGASEGRYASAQTALAKERARIADQQILTSQRLTQQFASMDARVASYKATQAFLTQQVDAWNADR